MTSDSTHVPQQLPEPKPRNKRGRKSAASTQSVNTACFDLVKEGKKVNYENVFSKLGSGSKATIYPYIRAWKEINEQPMPVANIPGALVMAIVDHTKNEVEKGIKHLQDKAVEAEEFVKDLLTEVTALEEALEGKCEELESLRDEQKAMAIRNQMQAEEQAKAEELILRLRSQLNETNARAVSAEAVQSSAMEHFNELFAAQSKSIEMVNEQITQIRKERDSCEGMRKQLEAELAQERSARSQLLLKHEQVTSELAAANQRADDELQRLMKCEQELQASKTDNDRYRKNEASGAQEIANLRQKLDESLVVRGRLEEQLRALKERFIIEVHSDDDSNPL